MVNELPEHPETLAELEKWIADGVEESITLDYKAAAALAKDKTAEIAKDVSAMANAAGGILIYGVMEFPKNSPKAHLPEKIDPVVGTDITKEWLEHIIGSGVQPRAAGILVKPIRLLNPPTGVVYVVVVPQGVTAHQATEKRKYYRRYNFESVAMLDHEIRDIMHRARHPQVRLALEISIAAINSPLFFHGREKETIFHWLNISVLNSGEKLASNVHAKLMVPIAAMTSPAIGSIVKYRGELYSLLNLDMAWPDNQTSALGAIKREKNSDPLLPKLSRHLKTLQLLGESEKLPSSSIFYAVYADEAPVLRAEVKLADIPMHMNLDGSIPIEELENPP